MREHPDRGRVDEKVGVGQVAVRFLVGEGAVASRAADADGFGGAELFRRGERRPAGSSGPEDQHRLARKVGGQAADQRDQPPYVGIVAVEFAAPVDHRIDRADRLREVGEFVKIRDHGGFIGDRHVDPAEGARPHKRVEFLFSDLAQFVGVAPEFFVDLAGETVSEFFPDQTVFHSFPLNQSVP